MTFSQPTYTLTVDMGGVDHPITVVGGSVTIDESWAPYIQATLECALPSQAVQDALDPRDLAMVRLTLVQDFDTWNAAVIPSTTFSATLDVRSMTITHPGVMRLELATEEGRALDRAIIGDGAEAGIYPMVDSFISAYLGLIDAALEPGYPVVSMDEPLQYPGIGPTVWEVLAPIVQQPGLRLYSDEERRWILAEAGQNTTDVINIGTVSTLQSLVETIDRQDSMWADSVVIKYTYMNLDGDTVIATDVAFNVPSTKTMVLEYTQYPGPGAARVVLDRATTRRGRIIAADTVNNFDARPGMQFVVTLPTGENYSGHISAVGWSLDDNRMTITPRDLTLTPDTAWVLLPPGEAWADSAPGVPWTTA